MKGHTNYIIRTAGYFARQHAVDATSAVLGAFIKRPPLEAGLLTKVRLAGDNQEWSYIDTAHVLKEATRIREIAEADAREERRRAKLMRGG